uniref:Uncharacterized protein n=1 Tax=Rhabditophanes sp. KR3021 TaxID=114890 RepID=A0AC35U8L6_9BILA
MITKSLESDLKDLNSNVTETNNNNRPSVPIPSIELTTEADSPLPKSPTRKDSTDGEDDNRLFLKIDEGYSTKGSNISYDAVGYHSDAVTSISNQSSPPYASSSETSPTQRQDLLNPMFNIKNKPEKHTFIGKGGSFNIFKSDNLLCPFGNSRRNSGVSDVNTPEANFCYLPVKLASLIFVFTTLLMATISFSYIIYQIRHTSPVNKFDHHDYTNITLCIIGCGIIYIAFSTTFIYGLSVEKKKWLLPLIFASISFCVAIIGASVSMLVTTASEIKDEITRLELEHEIIMNLENKIATDSHIEVGFNHGMFQNRQSQGRITDILMYRFLSIFVIIYQLITIVCYIKTYKYIDKVTRNECHPSNQESSEDVVAIACKRNPKLKYCRQFNKVQSKPENEVRRAEATFMEAMVEPPPKTESQVFLDSYEDEVKETRKPKRKMRPTPAPVRQNILYTVFPTLQKKSARYCQINEYTFAMTCKPGKKLRYDLAIFCDEFSRQCGIPNIHEFQNARPPPPYYPKGYGQKQENGHLGLGKSFAMGLGVIPGMTITGSSGTDVGKMPGLDQMGGLMFNQGTDIGILGERAGRGPERTMDALSSGMPSFGMNPDTKAADEKAQNAALRSLGIPPIPGLAKALGAINKKPSGKKGVGFEPGYDAVDKHALIATGKSDGNNVNLPGGMGTVEYMQGVGMGIGK